jgi:hypothetical protein
MRVAIWNANFHLTGLGLGKLLQDLKAAPVIVLLGLFVVLLSSLITISTGTSILIKWYHSTLGRKRALAKSLNRLSAGVSIGYFQNILGPAAFERTVNSLFEHVFVNPLFYVQAISKERTVVSFSVTTRRRWFNPALKLGPYSLTGEVVSVRLGKTRFAEMDSFAKPKEIGCSVGRRRFEYHEEFYFGNPGNYQEFVLSVNDAGFRHHPFISSLAPLSLDDPAVESFRREAVINTYTITAPLVSANDLKGISRGPSYDQVRVLDGYAGVSKGELRRLKRLFLTTSPYQYFTSRKPRMDWSLVVRRRSN